MPLNAVLYRFLPLVPKKGPKSGKNANTTAAIRPAKLIGVDTHLASRYRLAGNLIYIVLFP